MLYEIADDEQQPFREDLGDMRRNAKTRQRFQNQCVAQKDEERKGSVFQGSFCCIGPGFENELPVERDVFPIGKEPSLSSAMLEYRENIEAGLIDL